MVNRISDQEANYWSNVFISVSQVLFGIAAVTFFAGSIDLSKVLVITLKMIVAVICWFLGWRTIK